MEDYYFKSGGYILNCQAEVDKGKCYLDLYIGMLGSINDAKVLQCSSLNHLAKTENFFDARHGVDGFSSYLLGDSRDPLLPWLIVSHRM